MMEHGRYAPDGVLGGGPAAMTEVVFYLQSGGAGVRESGRGAISPALEYRPPHVSKDEGVVMRAGDRVVVRTPGGGGYGNPFERDPELVARDVRRGYFSVDQARQQYGVALGPDGCVDTAATARLRGLAAHQA